MKEIYEKLFDLCSEENKKIMQEFQIDTEQMSFKLLCKKYPFADNSVYGDRNLLMKESFFDIKIVRKTIRFIINTDFNLDYSFSTDFIYNIDKKRYDVAFTIFNNEKTEKYLCARFSVENNILLTLDIDDSLPITLKSKTNSISQLYEEYVFADEEIMFMILDNYSKPSELSDILLLNSDLNASEDEIVSNIINHAHLIKNHKKHELMLKSKP